MSVSNDDLKNLVAEIINIARAKSGVTEVAAGGSLSTGLSTLVRLGSIETVEFNRDKSLGITVYKGKRKGSVSISDFNPAAITSAVDAACRIADYTEADEYAGIAEKELLAKQVPDLDLAHPTDIDAEKAFKYAKQAEDAALQFDPCINNTEGASFSTLDSYVVYGNSNDFLNGYSKTRYTAYCTAIAADKGIMQRDYDYTVARDIHKLAAMPTIGNRAAERAVARLGAKKIKTQNAPVLFDPEMARGLWASLISAISGGNLYRKSSFLLDRLGHKIFPEFINVTEDPWLKNGLGSAPFDDEGVATTHKHIILDGTLTTYLLSCYSARRLGMRTTGNAGGVYNVTVKPGAEDQAALIRKMNTGLLVTELLGQGTNIVTGDYSHAAFGYWVENGQIQYPVEEITIAGNLATMFQNIVAVGSDLDSRGNIVTGSVLVNDMMIAGA